MNTVTISRPAPGEELVRLLNSGRSDELKVEGKSYRPDARGAFHVPRRHVTPELLTVGAFYPACLSKAEGLQDVAKAISTLPAGREKEALNAALVSLCEDAPEA